MTANWGWSGVLWAVLLGGTAGFAASWWLNQPTPPWLNFSRLAAHYDTGTVEITLSGSFVVNRECEVPAPVIWRTEAIATDGQLALYGPKPEPPDFTYGYHEYVGTIPLLGEISPDGWVVRVLVTCPGEKPETVSSPAARVAVFRGGGGVHP